VIPEREPFVQIFARVVRPRGGHIHDRKNDLSAHACAPQCLSGDIGEKVHIARCGYAAENHFRGRDFCAIADKIRCHPFSFHRPYFFIEPTFEWHVVGVAAQQRHSGVTVYIHQSRHQRVPWQFNVLNVYNLSRVICGDKTIDKAFANDQTLSRDDVVGPCNGNNRVCMEGKI